MTTAKILPDSCGQSMTKRDSASVCAISPFRRAVLSPASRRLAVSLHAPDNEIRDRLLPVNKRYPLEVLLPACRAYTERTGRRITFEYALIDGVNDSLAQAETLARLLHAHIGRLCHVNLIPLNRVSESGFSGSGRKHAAAFCDVLEKRGIPATVRRELGADIDAACGQLRMKTMERKK